MLCSTAEFIRDCDEYEVARTYSSLFIEPLADGEWELREAEEGLLYEIAELKDACSGVREAGEFVVFATLVPSGVGRRMIPDVSVIRLSRIDEIPDFMRSHPRLEEGDAVPDRVEWLSTPLLLTGLDEIAASSVYVPDGVAGYASLTIAALLYEVMAFGDGVSDSEARRSAITGELGDAIGIQDSPGATLDGLLSSMSGSRGDVGGNIGKSPPAGKMLKELERLRYNTRLEVYERMHADIEIVTKTRRTRCPR